jgi:hypothetical protein
VHARNQVSCAHGCWCPYDGDDGMVVMMMMLMMTMVILMMMMAKLW